MSKCIFCKIAEKSIDAFVIYENDRFLAFLDVNPKAKGHTLIIPKRHFENILDLYDDELKLLGKSIKDVVQILKEKLLSNGFTIGINHGKVAGQAVNHLHIHVIPRCVGDGGGSIHSIVNGGSSENVRDVYNIIKNKD